MITLQSTVVAKRGQASSDIGKESVVLDLDSGIYYGLNELGNRVWGLIQQPRQVEEVHTTILDEYDVDPKVWEQDLILLLKQMASEELIEVHG